MSNSDELVHFALEVMEFVLELWDLTLGVVLLPICTEFPDLVEFILKSAIQVATDALQVILLLVSELID